MPMPRTIHPLAVAVLLAGGLLAAGTAAVAQASAVNGQKLAQRHCGGCHAVSDLKSPLPGAPAFAKLYLRYPPGRLDQVLSEGMLSPASPPEEGSPQTHPRMPQVKFDDDQRADLKAYLNGLDPR
ncbi:cytochrome c [Caulobacter vibrioides]|uniref:c-type cytochrome n=1 Tax=Caulobacter vibrioides TaxID=155892 RepID=UPI000BB50062|nr:cytochrome c [Caulobacter vibrioides]ATC25865.1 cytochrome c [Caulobacter vibrioides]AZH14008.1 cytochrome c [Caulobacter vibrioides]PLR16495.1 cytochrome c [Caulobacter vibrioides]